MQPNKKINFFPNIRKKENIENEFLIENQDNCIKIKEKCINYKEFSNSLIKTTKKYNYNTKYITQGCCQIDNTTLLTYYESRNIFRFNKKKRNNNNSILEVLDEYGHNKNLIFDNFSHVGGIAYSKLFNKIYVTRYRARKNSQATISCYDIKTITSAKDNTILDNYQIIKLPESDHVSYLTIDNNLLYIGDFRKNVLVVYKLIDNGLSVEYYKTYKLNFNKVQGMCSFIYKNNKYYAFSCSYGRTKDSILRITKLINNNFVLLYSYKLPCMSEQISIDSDGNLMIVFESDSIKYSQGLDNILRKKSSTIIDSVCHIDINKLFPSNE